MKKLLLSILFLIISTSSWATVPNATPLFSQYSCNSSTNQFPYTFQISATSDIQVYINDNAGTITQQPTSTYSVDTSNIWVNYPLVGSPCPTGSTITLVPATPQTQLLSLTNRSPFVGSAIGSALDKLTLIDQQLQGQLNRAILAPAGTSAFTFPSSVPGDILGWDSGGSGNIVNYVPNTGAYLSKAVQADSQTGTNDTKYMTPAQVALEVNYATSSVISIPENNLAGSISDSKLKTISTIGKINTSAITVGGAIATAQGGTGSIANANTAGGVVVLNGSSQLPAVSGALVTDVSTFTYRGDVASYDFTVSSFNKDGNYHNLDLSSIIPVGTKAVVLSVVIQHTSVEASAIFTESNISNHKTDTFLYTQVSNKNFGANVTVPVVPARTIDYAFYSPITWNVINVTVIGWWQ